LTSRWSILKKSSELCSGAEMKLYYEITNSLIADWKEMKDVLLLHYTGSMFGLGCDARNTEAIDRINHLKNRPLNNGYIVLLPDHTRFTKYNISMNAKLAGLIRQYSPGSLTIVLPCEHPKLSHLQIAGKIAFRIPQCRLIREFLSQIDIPLISTSINKAGSPPEIDFSRIITVYKDWFDLALVPENELIAEGEPSTIITLEDDRLQCLRQGELDFEQLEEDYFQPLITFVCTGNICRSPLAEYYLRQQLEKHNLNYRTASAGFLDSGIPISNNSRLLLESDGIDSQAHSSVQLNQEIINRSRLILTMTQNHKNNLINSGWKSDHVFTLAEYTGQKHDVKDPYKQALEVYNHSYQQIKYYIDILIEKLKQEDI
jgi:tRNA threonylcarbamoyl adenosine modification protein (Sua5/YciO/YrdC/YwlC family)